MCNSTVIITCGVISAILFVSLGIATICKYETCGWNKDRCQVTNVYVKEQVGYTYELHGTYDVLDYYVYCTKNMMIEESDNKTYLQYLHDNVYTERSVHDCWYSTLAKSCSIKKKDPLIKISLNFYYI